jgi:hypothetical protein
MRIRIASAVTVLAGRLIFMLWESTDGFIGGRSRVTPPAVSFTVPPQHAGLRAEDLPQALSPAPACAVTQATGGTPPSETFVSHGVYTEDGIWVVLWPDGTVVFKPGVPGFVEPDGALSMKFPWWRPEKGGRLDISGRRLDAPAPPLQSSVPDGYDGQYFQATALGFPTQGCWEVTGRIGDAMITFVTLVLVRT